MSKGLCLKLYLIFLCISSPLFAEQADGEREVLKALCQFENSNLARYINPYFLSKLPVEKLRGILNEFKKEEGPCTVIEKIDDNNFLYTTNKSQRAVQLYLDKNKKIRGLWFGNATPFDSKLSTVISDLKKLPGKISLSLIKNGKTEILSYNADLALSVDSSAILVILKILAEKTRSTKLSWNSLLKIKEEHKSVPTGRLQDWPSGSSLTMQTYSTLAMAYSDNTAFDHLHAFVGRKTLERETPRNKPFLNTYEYYKLRGDLVEDYGAKKLKDQRKILSDLSKAPRTRIDMLDKPFQVSELGWFFTTKELCSYMYALKEQSFIFVNSGLAQKGGWDLASFVGGRGPGVLQYTQLLRAKKSKDFHCLSVSWNSSEGILESSKVDEIVGKILSKLR